MKPRVKSWDLYDTLIAKRNNSETDVFRIRENADQVLPTDIIVSDMWMSEERLRELSGFQNRMFVSDFGKGTGKIWPQVKAEYDVELHTGDNRVSDFLSARNAGIPSRLTTVALPTRLEAILGQKFPALAATMRETRLRTFDPQYRDLEMLQIQANFPLLFLASILLHRRTKDMNSILMSARDCYHWFQIMGFVQEQHKAPITVAYWPTSRIAKFTATPEYIEWFKSLKPDAIIDIGGTGASTSLLQLKAETKAEAINLVVYNNVDKCEDVSGLMIRDPRTNLELCNLAPHAMFDADRKMINPVNINWHRPEITVQADAVMDALDFATHYDFSTDFGATDSEVLIGMKYCYDELHARQKAADFAKEFLVEEDKWVMNRLSQLSL